MGHAVFALKQQTLATGANTTDAAHSFSVVAGAATRRRFKSVTITLGAGEGPCLAGAFLFQEGGILNGTGLGPRTWIRAPSLGGQTGNIYHWDGDLPVHPDAVIRIFVRNDTGTGVTWVAQWVTEL